MSVVARPVDRIEQVVRHVAAISSRGHTLAGTHAVPAELSHRLAAFDDALEEQIRITISAGIESGIFRPDLDLDTTTTLLRHLLNGVSELVAQTPDTAAEIAAAATETMLAALAPHTSR